jgi:phage FluMu protein Com
MAIEFHCEHCGKMIKTAKEHGGKQGKCPYCQKMVYIPVPDDELEPLKLAPLDPEAERKRQQLLDETRDLTRRIRREKGPLPPEPAKAPLPEPTGDVRLKTDMDTLVVEYVACMAAGNLSEAQEYAAGIRQDMPRAEEVIQRLTMDDIPPLKLSKIPHPVLVGFLRKLREGR